MKGYTTFQYDALSVVADIGPAKGLDVKDTLEERFAKYQQDVNHSRLYLNLDELAGDGLIVKSEHDGRTNMYRITEDGRRVLQERIRQLAGN